MKIPSKLEDLKMRFVAQITEVLENQTHLAQCRANNLALFEIAGHEIRHHVTHGLMIDSLDQVKTIMERTIVDYERLEKGMLFLLKNNAQKYQRSNQLLRNVIVDFNETVNTLSSTLIEKDLLERQGKVLESIILSHEKVLDWKAFVQQVLLEFHSIFPFNFFHIAFAEQHGISLYFYVLGELNIRSEQAKKKMNQHVVDELNIPKELPIMIEEFIIDCPNKETFSYPEDDSRLISLPVCDPQNHLAGLLGIFYSTGKKLTAQEETVIRSILSVMVMVVGSSKALARSISELEYYSVHDPLTGLYNRRKFNESLETEIARCDRHQHTFSLLMLDLDNFKDINDSFGHPTGDQALRAVADVLRKHIRKSDICARVGGDEFAILMIESNPEDDLVMANSIAKTLRGTSLISCAEVHYRMTASVGLICYPRDAKTVDDLFAGVDVAMYQAKQNGKNGVGVANACSDIRTKALQTRTQVVVLREALVENRIVPYYQSIVDCKSGDIMAFEALARLKTPQGQVLSASQFIDIIEKYGLAHELDKVMISSAIKDKKNCLLSQPHCSQAKIFLNLSAQEIQNRGILSFAEKMCEQFELLSHRVVFEVLERDAIGDMTNMRKFLDKLREKGFSFALDDFGSGYNSFHYLRELHFEFVKIDGEFIRNIHNSAIDKALVHNLSRLCQELGTLTIAEFVENQEVFDMLKLMGINYVQGYHISIPSPVMHM